MSRISATLAATLTNTGDHIWSAGVTKSLEGLPLSIGLEATNAMGVAGLGTLFAAPEPHLKVSVTWTTALDLL